MTVVEILLCTLLLTMVSDVVEAEEEGVGGGGRGKVRWMWPKPRTWRDLLVMNRVTQLSDFIGLLITKDGQPVKEEDQVSPECDSVGVFTPDKNENGQRIIAASGELLALPDECSPRNMSVRLDLNLSDPRVAYYPECIQVERCGGCTTTPNMACVAIESEIIVVWVLRARYPFPGALHLKMGEFIPVNVRRDLSCFVFCTLRAEDCGYHRVYLFEQCRCKCKLTEACDKNKVWDRELCECRCRNPVNCCGSLDSCPLFYDHDSCKCMLKKRMGCNPV